MKKYINKENEAQYNYVLIYIGFSLVILSGSMVVRGVLEGRGVGYVCLWSAGIVISLLIGISSTIKYKKK